MLRKLIPFALSAALLVQPRADARLAKAGRLTFVPGSTTRLEQLIGDVDKQRNAPTANQTSARHGIDGTDLGYSFEHNGGLLFLFGDTVGRFGGDVIGASQTTDPERGLALDFLKDRDGKYLRVRPPGLDMKGFDVPVSGINLDGTLYIVVKTNHSEASPTDMSVLTSFDESARTFRVLRTMSKLPDGRVIKMSMREAPEPIPGLPAGGPFVLIWSSGVYRSSNAYLSIVPKSTFESGKGTKYFSGIGSDQRPTWSDREKDAVPIVDHPTIGDLSVTWAPALKQWLMTYDSRDPRGIVFRHAATPWGPWSEAQIIFTIRDGRAFIHQAGRQDGLIGPVIGQGRANAIGVPGGAYAPYVIERFTKVEGGRLSIYYVLSTWNPYVVVLMRSSFSVGPT